MINDQPIYPNEILAKARKILLIDWPNTNVPTELVEQGFKVFCYSPGRYTQTEIEKGQLVFMELENRPPSVDIVNIYRPEDEHEVIITKQILPLEAKVIWLHPPITSQKTRSLAAEHGLTFVEGISITEVTRK
jgi:predicted CoA-binding protein